MAVFSLMEVTSQYKVASILFLNSQSQTQPTRLPALTLWGYIYGYGIGYRWAPSVHSMRHSGCPSVPATFVAYGMRHKLSALLGKMPRNSVCRLSARPWHQHGKSHAEQQAGHPATQQPGHPAAQPADTPAQPSPQQGTEVPRNPFWPCSSLAALRHAVLVCRKLMMKKQSRRSLNPQRDFEENGMFPLFFLQLRSQASLNESSCWLYS